MKSLILITLLIPVSVILKTQTSENQIPGVNVRPAPKDTPTAHTPPHSDQQPNKGSLKKKDMKKIRSALNSNK